MPKGTGRPFNKTERGLAKDKIRSRNPFGKGFSIAKDRNEHRERLRSMGRFTDNVILKSGLAPYVSGRAGTRTDRGLDRYKNSKGRKK